jgi:DNA-binding CsgD family transcriptional regulator
MSTTKRMLSAIDRIYAAAAREIPLDAALQAVADLTGDAIGLLFLHDVAAEGSSLLAACGIDAARPDTCDRRWSTDNPLLARGLADLATGRVIDADDLMPWAEFVETDYYRQFYATLDCRYGAATRIASDGPRVISLLMARHARAGPHSPAQRDALAAIRPHLARALHLLECFHGVAAVGLGLFRRAMDGLPFSVLLLDDGRRMIYANRRAQARLQAGDGIVDVRGRLSVGGSDREAFETGWNALRADPLGAGRHVVLRSNGDTAPLDLEVTCLAPAGTAAEGGRIWMLRLSDAPVSRRHLCTVWMSRFGLTAAECKVGLALLEHGDAVSIAATLRISDNTARAHLKSMFAKASVRSQASLALALSQPLRLVD